MIRKTIISVFLSAVILFSGAFTPIAQASVVDDTIVAYSEASWAQAMLSGILSTSGAMFISPLAGIAGGVIAEGINNLAEWYAAGHTDQEILDEYNSYVTDLGFTGVHSDGKLVWYPDIYAVRVNIGGEYGYFGDYRNPQSSPLTHYSASCSDMVNPTVVFQSLDDSYAARNAISLYVYYEGVCPIDGIYYDFNTVSGRLQILTTSNSTLDYSYTQSTTYSTTQKQAGDLWEDDASPGRFTSSSGGYAYSGQISAARPYVLIEPKGEIPVDSTSRPTTLTSPVAVRNDDDTYTVYNQNIVNETDSTIFNPVTNITTVFTDWAFDYSTRTYTLTLEDGSIVTVIYGDDCMTIIQGDQEYTVYYVIPSEEDPGADPDDPGTDDGSGWAWLQGAWTQMMDKLSGILEAITDLELSPEINVDVEVNEGEEVTQESWFDELLLKFAFLTSIHDIYTQLVADVTSDAATAAAVADGEVMLADVTNEHAAVYADERRGDGFYTAPELAISFGSSDKYGVDWAGIRPLNLSWYAPHKETVDGILSGILWLSYLFLLIKRAPGIIRGAEMVTEDRIKIYDWHMRNDP